MTETPKSNLSEIYARMYDHEGYIPLGYACCTLAALIDDFGVDDVVRIAKDMGKGLLEGKDHHDERHQ